MIEIKNLNVKYTQDFYSLFDVNLSIGVNTLLLGNEFCGANALFRILTKIDKKYDGEVIVDDINLKKIKDKILPIAYVSKENYFFKNKSNFENVFYPLKIRKVKKLEVLELINKELKYFKIDPNELTKNLDISKQKILCFIRAHIRNPKYLILEDFCENLNADDYMNFKNKLKGLPSIIIASESTKKDVYNNFKTINFENGSQVK